MVEQDPPTVEPDTKNWTWVLERPCPECGFDASTIAPESVAEQTRAVAAELAAVLREHSSIASRRPEPATWSAVEYGCHVRDVFVLFDRRLEQMLAEDDPAFENWDQDETAIERRYFDADPDVVADELLSTSGPVADRFATVRGDQWERTGRRSDGAVFTVDSFARYFLHDPFHHLHDVRSGLDALRQ